MSAAADVLCVLELGRLSGAQSPSARARRFDLLTRLLDQVVLPITESRGLELLVTLPPAALLHRGLVSTLERCPRVEIGVRLFGPEDRLVADDRDESIAAAVALHRQVLGREPLAFRADPGDYDRALGPSLIRQGLLADLSAVPRIHHGGLPLEPWWSDDEADLLRPGAGPLLEIPISVDLTFEEHRLALEPRAMEPFRYDDVASFESAMIGLFDRSALVERRRAITPLLVLEDLVDERTRSTRIAILSRLADLVMARDDLRAATVGTIVGAHASDHEPLPVSPLPEGGLRAWLAAQTPRRRAGTAGAVAEGRVELLVDPRPTTLGPARPLEVVLREARPGLVEGGLLIATLADPDDREADRIDRAEADRLVRLLGPSRGFRPRGLLVDEAGCPIVALLERRAFAGDRVAGPRPAAFGRRPLSFCIITGGRRPESVARVIASIEMQDLPDADIIVVGRHEAGPGYRYLAAEDAADGGRLGAMRNLAARAARHDHLVVLDDDILLTPGWARALALRADDFDILTSQVQLPEGGRYWDHATVGGARGHQLLEPDERDESCYMTGGGAWMMKRRVFEAIRWSDTLAFYEDEDTDFTGRCRAAGHRISHEGTMIAIHDDSRYTTVGRVVLCREVRPGPDWVFEELEGLDATGMLERAAGFVADRHLAEAADVIRHVTRTHPDDLTGRLAWRQLVERRGGPLAGVSFHPEGSPLYHRTLAAVAARSRETREILA
ncbi:MAG: glycosyltransferase [Planctomycetota bacterium]